MRAMAERSPIPAKYRPEPPAARMAAARVLFEGQPLTTPESVAAEVGVDAYWTRRWKREQGWAKATRALPDLSARAGQLADTFERRMSDLGKPLDDATAAAETARELSVDNSISIRAGVIDRHRKEWSAPRKIAYEAIQQAGKGDVLGAFERAKLAKITAETLTLVQAGECRAFGITHDAKAGDGATVVVVERSAGPAPDADPPAVTASAPDAEDF